MYQSFEFFLKIIQEQPIETGQSQLGIQKSCMIDKYGCAYPQIATLVDPSLRKLVLQASPLQLEIKELSAKKYLIVWWQIQKETKATIPMFMPFPNQEE